MRKAILAIMLLLGWSAGAASAPRDFQLRDYQFRDYHFRVFLDDDEIGSHSFGFQPLESGPGHYRLTSEASYLVKLLFVTVYSYSHRSVEQWHNGCLTSIDARSNDNGDTYQVKGERERGSFRVAVNGGEPVKLNSCTRSFAYWDPALLRGSERLLNSQTGVAEPVTLVESAATSPPWNGGDKTRTLELVTEQGPIRLWYGEDGEWLGLESRLENGRILQYRSEHYRPQVLPAPAGGEQP